MLSLFELHSMTRFTDVYLQIILMNTRQLFFRQLEWTQKFLISFYRINSAFIELPTHLTKFSNSSIKNILFWKVTPRNINWKRFGSI